MCEQTETETEPEATPRVALATILQSLVAESPNKPTLPVMLSMLDQAMDHTGLRLELAAAPADHEDDVAKASRRLSRRAYDMTSLLADGAAGGNRPNQNRIATREYTGGGTDASHITGKR